MLIFNDTLMFLGCHELGEFYQVVEQNVEEAKNIFKTNCEERNHAHSCFSLGYLFFTAKGKVL